MTKKTISVKKTSAKKSTKKMMITDVRPINLIVATRCLRDDMRTCFGVGDLDDPQFTLSAAHEHAV